jgi:hypothetical protein
MQGGQMIPTKPGYYWWSSDNEGWEVVRVWGMGIVINMLEVGLLVEEFGSEVVFRSVEEQKGVWGPEIEQYKEDK